MSDRLKEIAERVEKATPGPWKKTGPWFPAEPKIRQLPDVYSNVQTTKGSIADCWPWTDHGANAEFIAAAREDVPFLLAELQKEQREIARWVRSCQSLVEENTEANKLLEQTIEVLEGAVRFIEAALVICARSCAPGDGLHVAWANDICRKARQLSQKGRDEISR